jgi:hypothetical protein
MDMPPTRPIRRLVLCLTLLAGVGAGCQSNKPQYPTYQPATQPVSDTGLADSSRMSNVDAVVVPPAGWENEDPKKSEDHVHLSWKSPSGKTNYGVIYFSLPLPFSASWIYNPYLAAMKKSEGEANVIAGPVDDKSLPGLRFTVECGDYRMRTNLICKGFHGWAVYAGTLRKEDEVAGELELAERARDKTKVGVANANGSASPAVTRPTASAGE